LKKLKIKIKIKIYLNYLTIVLFLIYFLIKYKQLKNEVKTEKIIKMMENCTGDIYISVGWVHIKNF
jgi:hypothetical protein